MRVSVELVPRSVPALDRQLAEMAQEFPNVDTVNIPDLIRFPLRSWHACEVAAAVVPYAIPHVRAMDVDPGSPMKVSPWLERRPDAEVLVVSGDVPSDMSHPVYASTVLQVIRRIRREHPASRIYAAFDPYRQGLRRERDYAMEKLDAGADGLFTQPFFDRRLLEVSADLLCGCRVFWGFTSVVGEGSASYWESRNAVVFPTGFEPTLEWSRSMAREALAFGAERDADLYFMPIRIGPARYLGGIL